MPNQPAHCQDREQRIANLQEELLEVVLYAEMAYPWNPAEPETEAYFDSLEQEFAPIAESDVEAITPQTDRFFSQLNSCWKSWKTISVRESLASRFGDCVPDEWLEAIAAQAQTLVANSLSPIDRLVECVKPLLNNWAEEDLYLFARPVAQAMRSAPQQEMQATDWEQLSSIEQARYAMKVAQYAFVQLEDEPLD